MERIAIESVYFPAFTLYLIFQHFKPNISLFVVVVVVVVAFTLGSRWCFSYFVTSAAQAEGGVSPFHFPSPLTASERVYDHLMIIGSPKP